MKFLLGLLIGMIIGIGIMCILVINGDEKNEL